MSSRPLLHILQTNSLCSPGVLNCSAGLLTTVVNVYTSQKGVWSVTAKITAVVSGSSTGMFLALFVVYTLLLDKVRSKHLRVIDGAFKSRYEKMGGAFGTVFKRAGSSRDQVTLSRTVSGK